MHKSLYVSVRTCIAENTRSPMHTTIFRGVTIEELTKLEFELKLLVAMVGKLGVGGGVLFGSVMLKIRRLFRTGIGETYAPREDGANGKGGTCSVVRGTSASLIGFWFPNSKGAANELELFLRRVSGVEGYRPNITLFGLNIILTDRALHAGRRVC